MRPETANHAFRYGRNKRVMAEALAGDNVGKMHLDDRNAGAAQRVVDRDRSMGVGAGVKHDAGGFIARLLDPVDEDALTIVLAEIDLEAEGLRPVGAQLLDVGEGAGAVQRRLALAEQVQVRPFEDEDRCRYSRPFLLLPAPRNPAKVRKVGRL